MEPKFMMFHKTFKAVDAHHLCRGCAFWLQTDISCRNVIVCASAAGVSHCIDHNKIYVENSK